MRSWNGRNRSGRRVAQRSHYYHGAHRQGVILGTLLLYFARTDEAGPQRHFFVRHQCFMRCSLASEPLRASSPASVIAGMQRPAPIDQRCRASRAGSRGKALANRSRFEAGVESKRGYFGIAARLYQRLGIGYGFLGASPRFFCLRSFPRTSSTSAKRTPNPVLRLSHLPGDVPLRPFLAHDGRRLAVHQRRDRGSGSRFQLRPTSVSAGH